MHDRRQFIARALGTLVGAQVASSPSLVRSQISSSSSVPLRILFLGGTGYIGPHHVRAAVARGHKVSVFNRGHRQADLPPGVERLVGDRNGDLKSIQSRDWDAVVDLQTLSPGWIRTLGRALKGRVNHYTYISSVALYAESSGTLDERSSLSKLTDDVDPYVAQPSTHPQYRAFKVICEREAEAQFPGKTLTIRPGVICGPEDSSNWIGYWIWRMREGSNVLAPGDPLSPVQYIDARDLAEWTVSMIERAELGPYNAVGPALPMGLGELLGAVRSIFTTAVTLTWVPSHWLIKHGVKSGQASIFWVKPPDSSEPNATWVSYKVSCEKAIAKGLKFRSVAATLQDILAWQQSLPSKEQEKLRAPWKPQSEGDLLAAWKSYQARMQPSGNGCESR